MRQNYKTEFVFLLAVLLVVISGLPRKEPHNVLKVGPLKNRKDVESVEQLINLKSRQVMLYQDELIQSGSSVTLVVVPRSMHRVKNVLRKHRIPFHFLKNNPSSDDEVAADHISLDSYRPDATLHESLTKKPPDHTSYLSFDEQRSWMEEKAASSIPLTMVFYMEETYEGRAIPAMIINYDQTTKPIVWIDANLRACDWLTSAVALYLIDQILTGDSQDGKFLRNNFRFLIVPNANPDGYEYSRESEENRRWVKNRQHIENSNCTGVDLSRNFAVNWSANGCSNNPCDDNYAGPYQSSEKETQAIDVTMTDFEYNIKFYFSLESFGQKWFLPFAYAMSHPADYDELNRVAGLAVRTMEYVNGRKYEVGVESNYTGKISGTAYDYAKIYHQVPYSYSLKLHPLTEADGGVVVPPSQIIPTGQEILAGIAETCREARVGQLDA